MVCTGIDQHDITLAEQHTPQLFEQDKSPHDVQKKKKRNSSIAVQQLRSPHWFFISMNTGSLQYEHNKALSQTNSHASDQSVC